MISNNAAVSTTRFRPAKQSSEPTGGSGNAAANNPEFNGQKSSLLNSNTGMKESGAHGQGQSNPSAKSDMAALAQDASALGSQLTASQLAEVIARDALPTDQGSEPALEKITQQFKDRFAGQAANKEKFHELMKQSFGDKYDVSKAEGMRQQTLKGDFGWMPKIEVRSSSELKDTSGQQGEGVAQGAYNKADNTVYISRELLNSDPVQAEKILTEEVGHSIDASINKSDAAGDEGAIFSKLSHGEKISASEMKELRTENDKGVIEIDGKKVEVEYGLLSKIKKGIKGIGKGIKGAVKGIGKGIKGAFKSIGKGIKGAFKGIKKLASKAWSKVKKFAKKVLTSKWLGAVLKIASFIPGIGAFAAIASTVLSYAQAAYGVYQGVKNKSFAAALGGVAALAGGAAGIAGKMGASAGVVNTLTKFSTYAGKASQAYSAIKNKDIGAMASMAAGMAGADTNAGKVFSTVAKADAVYNAHKNGDTFGAISAGSGFLQDFTGAQGDKTLQTIARTSTAFGNMQSAIENKDYAGALSAANDAFGDKINLSPEARQSVEKLTGTIGKLQDAQQMYKSGDYLAAGQTLLKQASAYTSSDTTRQTLVDVGQALVKVDAAATAYKENRYGAAAALAADALGAPLDDKTKALLSTIQTKANQAQAFGTAIESKDIGAISASLSTLTNGATDGLTDRLSVVAGGVEQAQAMSHAIESKDFGQAAAIAANLAGSVAGKDSELATNLNTLSDILSGKVQISLADIFNGNRATSGINISAEAA